MAAVLLLLLRVFHREQTEALAEIEGRREALKQYAEAALSKRLHDALTAVEPRIEAASKDPLIDAEGTLYVTANQRMLPPSPPSPSDAALGDDDEASERPLVKAIVTATDDAALEKSVRALLQHRARWRTPVAHDAEALTEVVEHLLPRAAPQLLRGLLRDGFQGQDGLQRRLLRGRTQLTAESLSRWCARIATLSRRAGIEADDFEARCAEAPVADAELPNVSALPEGPSRLGAWYVERDGDVVRGLKVDTAAAAREVQQQMKQLGLVEPADWDAALSRARDLFRLKAGLLGLIGVLGVGVLALAQLAQRRKARFVELKEDFVAAVSHELKTPLASMRVMAETLQHRLEGHAAAKDYPTRLVTEVDGLTALIENILSFNRLDKGRWQPQRANVSLSSLEAVLRDDAPGAKLTFEGFDGATLNADPELLKLCLLNLLRNACKYNVRSPIEVAFSYANGVLRVTDNGIGIAPADRERVFEDFVRLKTPGAPPRPGTGLGLALCRRIAQMHGGTLTIEASSSAGTTMALTLSGGL
ncbi:MAG: HAMP domain-containing histidine kinase [Archangiaceae bacterium]|nr:HAMP domain-containing histidine kinase [Archangiaceae bacterium]